jgi:hypothetical protein
VSRGALCGASIDLTRWKKAVTVTDGISPGFSARFLRIIELAHEEARLHGSAVDDEHILVGLLVEGGSDAARLVVGRGLSLDDARARMSRTEQDIAPGAHVPFTNSAKQAVEHAQKEAARRWSPVSAEHMLLGLVDNHGTAATLLEIEPDGDDLRRGANGVDRPPERHLTPGYVADVSAVLESTAVARATSCSMVSGGAACTPDAVSVVMSPDVVMRKT